MLGGELGAGQVECEGNELEETACEGLNLFLEGLNLRACLV